MGIGQNLKNSVTGNVAKAKILLVQKEALGGLGVALGAASTLTDAGQTLGAKVLTVQFNPSSVNLYAHNEVIYLKTPRTQVDGELPQQQSVSAGTTMNVDLIFDDTNISDAFNMGNGVNTSVTNLVKTGVNMLSNKQHSVRKYVEAFIAAAVDPQYGNLVFEWGTFRFTGVMSNFSARYTMFNPKGEPIRATVSLCLIHTPTAEGDKLDTKDFDNLFKLTVTQLLPSADATPSAPPVSVGGAKFDELKTAYGDFKQFRSLIKVANLEFKEDDKKTKEIYINNISVELTSGYEASVATFSIFNIYDTETGAFDVSKIKNAIAPGAKVEILLGYAEKLVPVFVGFVAEVNFICGMDGAAAIKVSAMDVKGAMMANRCSKQLNAEYYSDAVKELLDSAAYGELVTAYRIDASPDGGKAATKSDAPAVPAVPAVPTGTQKEKTRTIEMVDESDYDFMLKAAKKFGFDFYVSNGCIIYRKPKDGAQALLRLKIGKGIISVDLGYTMIGITESIEARSTDVGKAESIIKKASVGTKFPYGTTGAKIIKNSTKVYVDPTISSPEDADMRVASLVEDMKYRFIQVECECVGLPDIIPGDYIELELIKDAVTKCYVTEVKHTMSTTGGYYLTLKAKADKLSDGV